MTNGEWKFLYVLCGGNASVVVFSKDDLGNYSFLHTVSNTSDDVSGLSGVTDMAFTSDGSLVFVASEFDNAIVTFQRNQLGELKFHSILKSNEKENNELIGASSVFVTPDDNYLLVTSGEGDSLIVYRINDE